MQNNTLTSIQTFFRDNGFISNLNPFLIFLIIYILFVIFNKKLLGEISNNIATFTKRPIILALCGLLIPLYINALDIYDLTNGKNKEVYNFFFQCIIFTSMGAAVIWITDLLLNSKKKTAEQKTISVQKKEIKTLKLITKQHKTLLNSIRKIITLKTRRFYNAAQDIQKTDDIFLIITEPSKQIELISVEIKDFLKTSLKLGNIGFVVSIIQFNNNDFQNASYLHRSDFKTGFSNTDFSSASEVMQSESVARKAFEARGDVESSIFHPCKDEASERGEYFTSEVDKQRNTVGSIYCSAMSVTIGKKDKHYVVCISTAGKRLCEPNDEKQKSSIKLFLDEFMYRMRLEFNLLTMREYKETPIIGK